MKLFVYMLILVAACSCRPRSSLDIYQGSLEELVVGEFILYKDVETKYIHNLRTVTEREDWVILSSYLPDNSGIVFKFYDIGSSELIRKISIPFEGPEALKGGRGGSAFLRNEGEVILIGGNGNVGSYDSSGRKTNEWKVDFHLPSNSSEFVTMETRKGLMVECGDWIQVGQDPSNPLKNFDPKSRLMSSEFPLDFSSWLSQINLKTGQVRHSVFHIPRGYELFQGDVLATQLFGAVDTKRGDYYLGWPFSDTLYKLRDMELVEKLKPQTSVDFKYMPSERIAVAESSTVWMLPKEASQHIFLLYDEANDLFIRASKINESGIGETKFERTKHYVLQVFTGEWVPLGEYFFDFESVLDLENWFLTGKGLYLNKPEQPLEDEYVFWHVDLSNSGTKN
ncbi:hypothetical protein [Negadavirga shengliensis]|uniref:6-bladed beta-propeller n=1 Tax=Negadavirga shengliensis TaxID=1389218 RepID=A0ABV9T3K1_9BACT